jgi:hypothetical protein
MTKRTREIHRQKNKIRKQEEKKAWGVMLYKYGLYADLDKTWDLGVRALRNIPHMVPDDMPLFNLTGTLAQYRDMYRMEKALEEAA